MYLLTTPVVSATQRMPPAASSTDGGCMGARGKRLATFRTRSLYVASPIGFLLVVLSLMGGVGWQPSFALLLVPLLTLPVAHLMVRRQYPPVAAIEEGRRPVVELVTSQREYALILRPFGWDGETLLPVINALGVKPAYSARPTMTLEQVVAKAARKSAGVETYALVDQSVTHAPPGPTYVRLSHDDWQWGAQHLIARAHSIVLLLPPYGKIRESLSWELEQIRDMGYADRVVLVLPAVQPGQQQDARVMERAAPCSRSWKADRSHKTSGQSRR
jgi:hypothetical protein